jgi:ribonuclease I
VALWDDQSFTIHGIWPDAASSTSFGAFNVGLLQKEIKLLDEMQNYWPPKAKASTSNVFLWQHEWETHGKDYANILFKLKPESFPGTVDARNAALQLAFYKDVIAFYLRFKVKKLTAGTYTHAAIASAIGLAQNQFVMLCTSSNIVREMQVCFDIAKGGITPKACSKTTNCAGGGQTIQLLNWRIKGQSRVTNYPASSSLTA